jgi:DNA-binding beta-propeller fold protein YncE
MAIARLWLVGAAMAILCWLTPGCSDRERLNPLDPLNSNNRGIPIGLSIIALRDTVQLAWQPLALRNLAGYRIYRRTNADSLFALIDSVPSNQQRFREFGLTFGVHYVYRLAAFSGTTESNPSDTVGITVGPAYTWVADPSSGAVVKFTHDGRRRLSTTRNFQRPFRLQANPKTGQLWVLDSVIQELRRVEANGARSLISVALQRPVDVAIDSVENSVWAADGNTGIYKFDGNGATLIQIPLPGVVAIAFNYASGELWALNGTQRKLWRVARYGFTFVEVPVVINSPKSISIHAASGEVWIADSTRVLVVHANGQVDTTTGHVFSYARRVAVNQNSGEAWVIDWSPVFAQSKVVKFTNRGERLFTLTMFSAPSALSVNAFDGSCFITEPQLSRITHVSGTGQIINQLRSLSTPTDVDVENRPY